MVIVEKDRGDCEAADPDRGPWQSPLSSSMISPHPRSTRVDLRAYAFRLMVRPGPAALGKPRAKLDARVAELDSLLAPVDQYLTYEDRSWTNLDIRQRRATEIQRNLASAHRHGFVLWLCGGS